MENVKCKNYDNWCEEEKRGCQGCFHNMFSPSLDMEPYEEDQYKSKYNSFEEKELLYLILLELKKLNERNEDYE